LPLALEENPDILATLSKHKKRPGLVIGFAAETNDVVPHAQAKLTKKSCDWIVANDVSGDVMGGDNNAMILITKDGVDQWPVESKLNAARRLAGKISENLA